MDIIFATTNPGKKSEFETILSELNVACTLYTPDLLGIEGEVEETGVTFAENARIKALEVSSRIHATRDFVTANVNGELHSISNLTNAFVVAEDSGLVVPALNGFPGINSKRIGATDTARIESVLSALESKITSLADSGGQDRETLCRAKFVCCAALVVSRKVVFNTCGEVEGQIIFEPSGHNGFGYDPIFYYPPASATFAEMSREEKSRVSHRRRALESVVQWIILDNKR